MCYNKNVSIAAYVTSTILGLILFKIGDKYDKNIAIFILVFNQIQLAEYFMWIDQNCGNMNHYATIYAQIIVMLQPISILVGALIYKTFCLPNAWIYIMLTMLVIPLLTTLIMMIKNKRKLCSKDKKNGHLDWDFVSPMYSTSITDGLYYIYWMIIIVVSWLFFKNRVKGLICFGILGSTLLYSTLDTSDMRFDLKQWESKWCLIGAMCPAIYLLLKLF